MPSKLNQGLAIDNLNKYLEWHNLPVRVDKRGICNGLASVHAKYVLEEKENEFFEILNHIATMTTTPNFEDKINHFVVEVVLSFMPALFDQNKSQSESIEFLQIKGKKLESSFNLGLIANHKNWQAIFNELNLRDSEVAILKTTNHAFTVRKFQGQYQIYDPNYDSGSKNFADEKELVDELYRISKQGRNTGSDLGLKVHVIRHPDHMDTARTFPGQKELYKKYFDPNKQITMGGGIKYSSLMFALTTGDEDSLEELLKHDFSNESPILSFLRSDGTFSPHTFDRLLSKLSDKDDLGDIFKFALRYGQNLVFDSLLKNDKCLNYYNNHIVDAPEVFIISASLGGNIDLLQQVISEYEKARKDEKKFSEVLQIGKPYVADAIHAAIVGTRSFTGGLACVQFLLNKLRAEDFPLDVNFYKKYLVIAIRLNQPHTVDFIVDAIKHDLSEDCQTQLFQSIYMEVNEAERTDLSILRTLKKENVVFSNLVQGVFDKKENRPIGTRTEVGIALVKFTDFINWKLEFFKEIGKQISSRFKELFNAQCNRPVDIAITFIPVHPRLQEVLERFNELQQLKNLKGCKITDGTISFYDDSTSMELINYAANHGIDVHAVDSEGKIKFWSNSDGVVHSVPEGQRLTPKEFLSKHENQLSENLHSHILQAHNIEPSSRLSP